MTIADPELRTLTVQAESLAARLRAHDRLCAICSATQDPERRPCGRRDQLQRLYTAARALVDARRRALRAA